MTTEIEHIKRFGSSVALPGFSTDSPCPICGDTACGEAREYRYDGIDYLIAWCRGCLGWRIWPIVADEAITPATPEDLL